MKRKKLYLIDTHPHLAAEWHPTRNGDRTPYNTSRGHNNDVWWLCSTCGHEWKARVDHRTNPKSPCGCPKCRVPRFTQTYVAETKRLWHPHKNGDLTADSCLLIPANTKVWLLCPVAPDHEWEVPLSRVLYQARGCPFCSGQRVCKSNCLETLHPNIAAEWHPDLALNNYLTPSMVTVGSRRVAVWLCSLGHTWKARIDLRTNITTAAGCSECFASPDGPCNFYFTLVVDHAWNEKYIGIGITVKDSLASRYQGLHENLELYPYFMLRGRNENIKPLENLVKREFQRQRIKPKTPQDGFKTEAFKFEARFDIKKFVRMRAEHLGIDVTPMPEFDIDLLPSMIPVVGSSELTNMAFMV